MIHPLYFPQTCLTNAERRVIRAGFEKVSVFSPCPDTVCEDRDVEPVIPVSANDQELAAMLREYRNFATLNIDRASSFLRSADRKPFYDATWASELRGEIMRHTAPGEETHDESDILQRLLWARFFLQIAHEYDEKNLETDSDLQKVGLKEKQLLKNLMGDDGEDATDFMPFSGATDPADRENLVNTRMEAWSTLFIESSNPSVFFVTGSPEVVGMIGEFVSPFVKLEDIPAGSIRPDVLEERITGLVQSPFDGEKDAKMTGNESPKPCLSLYIAPGLSPWRLFSRFSGGRGLKTENNEGIRNTVIGLIRI
jgi:hypothetical protein